jgi:hypothetical protein
MASVGRLLIIVGVVLVVLGILLGFTNFFSYLRFGRLPGDINIKRENFRFYFPITTSILLSLVLTLILYFFRK